MQSAGLADEMLLRRRRQRLLSLATAPFVGETVFFFSLLPLLHLWRAPNHGRTHGFKQNFSH
jgi:hypothetical protein